MSIVAKHLTNLQKSAMLLEDLRHGAAEHVRAIREQTGLSQKAFAERLGVSQASVAKWELGTRHPKRKVLVKLSELCAAS